MRKSDFVENNLNVLYEQQDDFLILYVKTKEKEELHIGIWANRCQQYLKQHHRVRYYNLRISEKLYKYLSDIEEQAENYFRRLVKFTQRIFTGSMVL